MHSIVKNHKAPGPKGHFLLGSLSEIRSDRIRFINRLVKTYGNVVRFRMGPKVLHLISHPDDIKHVLLTNHQNYVKGLGLTHAKPLLGNGLLTSEGMDWSHQRKLIVPAFHKEKMNSFFETMKLELSLMMERWRKKAILRERIDVENEMKNLTLSILGRTLFNIDLTDNRNKLHSAFTLAIADALKRMTALLEVGSYLPSPASFRFRKSLRVLDDFIYKLIREKEEAKGKNDKDENDLVSILLSAINEDTGRKIDHKQLRDEIITLLLAGHETTSIVLTWSIYLLAIYKNIQSKVRSEANSIFDKSSITVSELNNFRLGKMVINEVMRLYPPVWIIPRKSIKADKIGNFQIPAGTNVLISVYTLHRHPEYWTDPDLFNPERFEGDAKKGVSEAFIPFGYGPRTCIGNHFALMEIQLALCMIIKEFSFTLSDGHEEVNPHPLLTLRPESRIFINVSQNKTPSLKNLTTC